MANENEKSAAAGAAMRFVQDHDIVGLGSGSTSAYALRSLAERVHAGLQIRAIPTSLQVEEMAKAAGIPLTTFDEVQQIDVTIDGADEFDPDLNLIKGGGGALLHEKIVASASRQLIIITDSSRQVRVLGRFPLPVEVIPFAEALIVKEIENLGARVTPRRLADGKPFVTDEHNHILDCYFGKIPDAAALARKLETMPGVVEHGLFIGMASVVLVAKGSEVQELHRPRAA